MIIYRDNEWWKENKVSSVGERMSGYTSMRVFMVTGAGQSSQLFPQPLFTELPPDWEAGAEVPPRTLGV